MNKLLHSGLALLLLLAMSTSTYAQKGAASATAPADSPLLVASGFHPHDTVPFGHWIVGNEQGSSPAIFIDATGATAEAENNPSASCTFNGPGNDGNNSVYFYVRATASGEVTFDTNGSGYDTIITLLDAFNLSEIGCNDDDPSNGSGDFTSRMTVSVNEGFLYTVRVTGFGGAEGDLFLTTESDNVVTGPPGDPSPAIAGIPELAENGLYADSNIRATADEGEVSASCAVDGNNSIWRFIGNPGNGSININLAGSGFDTVLTIYDRNDLGSELGCNDDANGTTRSELTVDTQAGSNYVVRITGFDGAEGPIDINYTFSPSTSSADEQPAPMFALLPPVPNPANSRVTFAAELSQTADVQVEVFDMLGRSVAVLNDAALPAGRSEWTWNASQHAPGVYVVRLVSSEGVATKKVTVMR